MTLNINAIEESDVNSQDRLLQLEALVTKYNPDILCLQEVENNNVIKIQELLDSLFNYSSMYDGFDDPLDVLRYSVYSKYNIYNFTRYCCDCSDLRIKGDSMAITNIDVLSKRMPCYSAEIEYEPNQYLAVFSCHLQSNAYSTAIRSLDKCDSWFHGIPLYLQNIKNGIAIRSKEALVLREAVNHYEEQGLPILMAGDFNDFSNSKCMKTIQGETLSDAWWEAGVGLGFSYHGYGLSIRIDHILFSNDFSVDNMFVVKSSISDHYPLIADFSI